MKLKYEKLLHGSDKTKLNNSNNSNNSGKKEGLNIN